MLLSAVLITLLGQGGDFIFDNQTLGPILVIPNNLVLSCWGISREGRRCHSNDDITKFTVFYCEAADANGRQVHKEFDPPEGDRLWHPGTYKFVNGKLSYKIFKKMQTR
jgi:hypothetical protein